jgi:hypothetical protein
VCPGFQAGDDTVAAVVIPRSVESLLGFFRFAALREVAFEADCRVRCIGGFCACPALERIEIPASVESVKGESPAAAFCGCAALREVVFAPGSRVVEIQGFSDCPALGRIEIPPAVECVRGFNKCVALRELVLAVDGRLREIEGFDGCAAIQGIDVPASVEQIRGFDSCQELGWVRFAPESRIRVLTGMWKWDLPRMRRTAFVEYVGTEFLKRCRRKIQLCVPSASKVATVWESDGTESDGLPSEFEDHCSE